jgi:hypothetical protein
VTIVRLRHHRDHRATPTPRTHPCLRRTPHQRRTHQTRDHPLSQALHRPRNLRQSPTPTGNLNARGRTPPDRRLTNIGASNDSTKPSNAGLRADPDQPP